MSVDNLYDSLANMFGYISLERIKIPTSSYLFTFYFRIKLKITRILQCSYFSFFFFRVGGGTGFIGRNLSKHLKSIGYDVIIVSRRPGPGIITWVSV